MMSRCTWGQGLGTTALSLLAFLRRMLALGTPGTKTTCAAHPWPLSGQTGLGSSQVVHCFSHTTGRAADAAPRLVLNTATCFMRKAVDLGFIYLDMAKLIRNQDLVSNL